MPEAPICCDQCGGRPLCSGAAYQDVKQITDSDKEGDQESFMVHSVQGFVHVQCSSSLE